MKREEVEEKRKYLGYLLCEDNSNTFARHPTESKQVKLYENYYDDDATML